MVTYTMKFDGVVQVDTDLRSFVLNRHSLTIAINHIRKDRDAYATEEAWLRRLEIYEGALRYLDAHQAEAGP